jgi:hypothetical protein
VSRDVTDSRFSRVMAATILLISFVDKSAATHWWGP